MPSIEQTIFEQGSTTYYWSSRFFPPNIREDVFRFYSFVRVIDDYVDQATSDRAALQRLKHTWRTRSKDKNFVTTPDETDDVDTRVIKNIVYVVRKYHCPDEWVESFFDSMEMDVKHRHYLTMDDTLRYIYGSAEVIGLFMARIMGLPKASYSAARMQGRAMQFVNFIRDVQEDNHMGRLYFPASSLRHYDLQSLQEKDVHHKPHEFKQFMREQVSIYNNWQQQANKGFAFIPRRLRVPLRTAVDMYNWTAKQIEKDPLIVFTRKVKPSKWRVIRSALFRLVWS